MFWANVVLQGHSYSFLEQHTRVQSQEGTASALSCTLSETSGHQPKENDAWESQRKACAAPSLSKFIMILNIHKVHC